MSIKFYLSLVLVFVVMGSCKNKSDKIDAENAIESQEIKNISELTFQEILFLLYKENEFGSDYHGESFGQEASDKISLTTKSKTECGDLMMLVSTASKRTAQVAVMATFSFPNNPNNELAMTYLIKPGETLPVGRNKFCYDGKEYDINRKVLSAGYMPIK